MKTTLKLWHIRLFRVLENKSNFSPMWPGDGSGKENRIPVSGTAEKTV